MSEPRVAHTSDARLGAARLHGVSDPASAWRDAVTWLLPAVVFLLPFGAAAELPVLVAAMWVLARFNRIAWQAPATRLALLVFGAYWVPELLSAFDSLDARKSWLEVAADLRFGLLMLFASHALRDAARVRAACLMIAVIAAFWCIDALVQAAFGVSLGGAAQADRLSGIFGDDNLKLGGVIAVLSPFVLLAVPGARGSDADPGLRNVALFLAFAALLAVVLLAGARAAWLMFAIGIVLLAWQRLGARRGTAALAALLLAALVAAASAAALSPRFMERIDRSTQALRGDAQAIDYALSHRLPIWRTALAMTAAHPVNGIGVRAFHEAYASYAAPGDHWLDPANGNGAFHAHQWLLEVLSETGGLGLLCWLAGIASAWRAWVAAAPAARARAAAPAIALAAMLFPLNTHYAVYSSFWGLLLAALLALWIAALHAEEPA